MLRCPSEGFQLALRASPTPPYACGALSPETRVETLTSAPPQDAIALTPAVAGSPNDYATAPQLARPAWPLWQRVAFRFFCIYWVVQIEPWGWFRLIPGVSFLLRPYDAAMDWAVRASNAHVFHVRETL